MKIEQKFIFKWKDDFAPTIQIIQSLTEIDQNPI